MNSYTNKKMKDFYEETDKAYNQLPLFLISTFNVTFFQFSSYKMNIELIYKYF